MRRRSGDDSFGGRLVVGCPFRSTASAENERRRCPVLCWCCGESAVRSRGRADGERIWGCQVDPRSALGRAGPSDSRGSPAGRRSVASGLETFGSTPTPSALATRERSGARVSARPGRGEEACRELQQQAPCEHIFSPGRSSDNARTEAVGGRSRIETADLPGLRVLGGRV